MIKTVVVIQMAVCMMFSLKISSSFAKDLDQVLAVVGNNAIMLSDIEQEIVQIRAQGSLTTGRELFCSVLEQQMINRLFLTQAKIDSLEVSQGWVEQNMEQRLTYMVSQMGSQAEVEKVFGKPYYKIKEELKARLEEMSLIQQMQQKIGDKVQVTPNTIIDYYHSLPKDSLPTLPDQYLLQQLIMYPKAQRAARLATRERLLELRERVIGGEKFATLAMLYSEDPGSARRGGEYGLSPRTNFVKPFADAAFALKTAGQVSPIVETEYGFHIIQLIARQGDLINVRHILLKPQYTSDVQTQAIQKLDTILNYIKSDSMTFEQAVLQYSEDAKSRLNGGYIVNQQTLSRWFEKEQITPPTDFYAIRSLKENQISAPFTSQDEKGQEVYKILKLTKFIPSHTADLEQDYNLLSEIARANEQQKMLQQWIKNSIKQTYISISKSCLSCNLRYNEWMEK